MAVITNKIIILNNYAEIILPKKGGKEKARTLVSLGDVGKCKSYRWFIKDNGYVYASIWFGSRKKRKSLYLHRFLLNAPNGLDVDHINNDKLDNRRDNLRLATRSQNLINKKEKKIRGVRSLILKNGLKRWQARIKINQKEIFLGVFNNRQDAEKARVNYERNYFGEFATI